MGANLLLLAIFFFTYLGLVTERVHRTTVVMLSALLVILLGYLPVSEAWQRYIDYNTLGLLLGMMVIVNITKRTGLFEWVAIRVAKAARGNPWHILLFFFLITAVFSAFLDNVTTVLVVAPITLLIAQSLGKSPYPLLVGEIVAANLGGAGTLIGDPPNILVGSAAGLSFTDFVRNLVPAVLLLLPPLLFLLRLVFHRTFKISEERRAKVFTFDEAKAIKDKLLLWKCLVVFSLTIAGFLLHHRFGLLPSTVALSGAVVLLLVSGIHPGEVFKEIEWPTLFFFAGLFCLVGSLDRAGIISSFAKLITRSVTSPTLLVVITLWLSGILASFIGAVPVAAAMIPFVKALGVELSLTQAGMAPLWWSLALGASLGGNGSLVGAAANMVVAGISEKTRTPLTFGNYFRIGFPVTMFTIFISGFYLLLRYF